MIQLYKKWIIVGIVVCLILLLNSLFVVGQTQQAIVLEFGKPITFKDGEQRVSFIRTPGLKLKKPFIQDVLYFDNMVLNFSAEDKEVLDQEKKALSVNAFVKYRIVNPLMFYEKVTNQRGINERLNQIFEASLRDAIGSVPLGDLLTEARKEVMKRIRTDVSQKAKDFGIDILDVRIVRSDLPKENSDSIYKRMYAERDKEAREYRAEGEEQATIIRSTADRTVKVILAEANRESNIIRGDADAEVARIFADVYTKDPEFFAFYRTMDAYKHILKKDTTRMVLSADSEFLKYFMQADER